MSVRRLCCVKCRRPLQGEKNLREHLEKHARVERGAKPQRPIVQPRFFNGASGQ